ncbi:hypothetical protein PHK61_13875 [Actinomycetospora lutea]|uniref:hypothetical protein n=1 Tax=Actinomycetospora lutea TaxID=663604 RepID=UPI0023670F9B|nr:hypothetical protein [Actinomycetospora lutea]MDD7939507.1 hypothetical protein [Actinomycetospora lutea]
MTTEPTRPEPARPLSEQEKAVLARLAADLEPDTTGAGDDSRPEARRAPAPRPSARLALQVLVVVVLAAVLMPSVWVGVVLAVVVLSGPAAATWWELRSRRR